MDMASFGDAERWSISTGDAGLMRLECARLHRVLIESANDDSFGADITSQLSLLPDGASIDDLKSLFRTALTGQMTVLRKSYGGSHWYTMIGPRNSP